VKNREQENLRKTLRNKRQETRDGGRGARIKDKNLRLKRRNENNGHASKKEAGIKKETRNNEHAFKKNKTGLKKGRRMTGMHQIEEAAFGSRSKKG
jgi:hypothetical protein